MKLHEYQAKEILSHNNVKVPHGHTIFNISDIDKIKSKLQFPVVVKAQVHSGARGKAGGVKVTHSFDETIDYANSLLGQKLVTHQTGDKGLPINSLLIEEAIDIDKEYYIALTIDGSLSRPVFISSPEGGMDIEAVAEQNPQAILKTSINPSLLVSKSCSPLE